MCRERRRCSRDTYPESYIAGYTLVHKDNPVSVTSPERYTLKQKQLKSKKSKLLSHFSFRGTSLNYGYFQLEASNPYTLEQKQLKMKKSKLLFQLQGYLAQLGQRFSYRGTSLN